MRRTGNSSELDWTGTDATVGEKTKLINDILVDNRSRNDATPRDFGRAPRHMPQLHCGECSPPAAFATARSAVAPPSTAFRPTTTATAPSAPSVEPSTTRTR